MLSASIFATPFASQKASYGRLFCVRQIKFVTALVVGCLISAHTLASTAIARDASYKVSGLTKPLEIIVDEWGVPHIYADDHYDAFFGQGFNAARDRLWRREGEEATDQLLGDLAEPVFVVPGLDAHDPADHRVGDRVREVAEEIDDVTASVA